jgi:hypothetical protein
MKVQFYRWCFNNQFVAYKCFLLSVNYKGRGLRKEFVIADAISTFQSLTNIEDYGKIDVGFEVIE